MVAGHCTSPITWRPAAELYPTVLLLARRRIGGGKERMKQIKLQAAACPPDQFIWLCRLWCVCLLACLLLPWKAPRGSQEMERPRPGSRVGGQGLASKQAAREGDRIKPSQASSAGRPARWFGPVRVRRLVLEAGLVLVAQRSWRGQAELESRARRPSPRGTGAWLTCLLISHVSFSLSL